MDRPEPEFALGQRVRVVLNDRNRTPHEGTIRAAVWHHQQGRFHYHLLVSGRKVSKRYAAEDLQSIGIRRCPDTIGHLWPLWCELDRLLLREFQCWPWESQNPEVHAVWERLTHSDNLSALEDWAQGVESFNEYAKGMTLRALAECRARAARQAERFTAHDGDERSYNPCSSSWLSPRVSSAFGSGAKALLVRRANKHRLSSCGNR